MITKGLLSLYGDRDDYNAGCLTLERGPAGSKEPGEEEEIAIHYGSLYTTFDIYM